MLTSKIARAFLWLCATVALVPGAALAEQFPSKPIRILIGYSPGGGMDSLARLLAPKLTEILKVPVVIENKPGASELMASQPVLHAAPDGYTLWLGSAGAMVQGPAVRTDLPYDPVKNFTPIAMIADGEAVLLARKQAPGNTMSELVAYSKNNRGKLTYGSAGVGSGSHLAMEYMIALTGASMLHIPYKGEAESTRDAMAGNVDVVLAMVQTAVPLITAGKLKPIAVTGTERLKSMPDLPTIAQTGVPGLEAVGSYTFYAVMGPAGMPQPIVKRINEAFNKAIAMPDVAQRMREVSLRPHTDSPEAFARQLAKDLATWKQLRGKVKIGDS